MIQYDRYVTAVSHNKPSIPATSLRVANITARKSDNPIGSVFLDKTRIKTSHSSCNSKAVECLALIKPY